MVSHWTNDKEDGFATAITIDYFDQLEDKLEEIGLSRSEYAGMLGVDPSRISQLLNTPFTQNPSVKRLVQYVRPLGLKVAIVVYDDKDPTNSKGPVFSGILAECWKKLGSPRAFSLGSTATNEG